MSIHCTARAARRVLPWLTLPVFAFAAAISAAPAPDVTPAAASMNGAETRLLRSPAVSAERIAFVYANNTKSSDFNVWGLFVDPRMR